MRSEKQESELKEIIENPLIPASEINPELITGYRGIYNHFFKRAGDFIVSLLLLAITAPLFAIISAAILCESGFPVFYRAERGGYHGKPFKICKFRTMVKDAERIGGGTTALHDVRITRIGAVLRKLKLDEFPNLFNIAAGQMSFIGPRPELLFYTQRYAGSEMFILEVRPGITDYSSMEFINLDEIVGDKDADKAYEERVLPRKNKLRVKYAATISFTSDLKIFFGTVFKVLEKAYGYLIRKEHR